MDKYEIVIGLEIHAELCTESKLFCNCAYTFGASANDCTCPILFRDARHIARHQQTRRRVCGPRRAGDGTAKSPRPANLTARTISTPTCRRTTQISQYDIPLCQNGQVTFEFNGELRTRRASQNSSRRGRRKIYSCRSYRRPNP